MTIRKSCEYSVLNFDGYAGPEEQRDQYVYWAFHLQEWQNGKNGDPIVLKALAYDLISKCIFQVYWETGDSDFLKGAFLNRFSHHHHQQTNGKVIQEIGTEEGRLNNLWERAQEKQERIPLNLYPSALNQYNIKSLPYTCVLFEHPYIDEENEECVLLLAIGEHHLQYIAFNAQRESLSYFLIDSVDPEPPTILVTNEQGKTLAVCTIHWHTIMKKSGWEERRDYSLEWN